MNRRNRATKRNYSLQWMTGTALMIAVTLVLASTPLGRITLPFLTATTVHIPVIIATLTLGLRAGMLTGLVFGVHSLISNLTGASFFAPFFINPLVSVLPRMVFPAAVYLIALVVKRLTAQFDKRHAAAYVLASALGTAVHTLLVMGMIALLYADRIAQMLSGGAAVPEAISANGVGAGIAVLGAANALPEMIVAAVIAPVISMALDRALGRMIIRKA